MMIGYCATGASCRKQTMKTNKTKNNEHTINGKRISQPRKPQVHVELVNPIFQSFACKVGSLSQETYQLSKCRPSTVPAVTSRNLREVWAHTSDLKQPRRMFRFKDPFSARRYYSCWGVNGWTLATTVKRPLEKQNRILFGVQRRALRSSQYFECF